MVRAAGSALAAIGCSHRSRDFSCPGRVQRAPLRERNETRDTAQGAAKRVSVYIHDEPGGRMRVLKTTRYVEEQVLRKRPYMQREWCRQVLAAPIRREAQTDGRIRFWGRIVLAGEARARFLRVDGETIHNAFFDRNFREDAP
jgi:hypothetical protein